jgi:hypothetical protein
LQEYGLASVAPFPTTPKPIGPANVNEKEGMNGSSDAKHKAIEQASHVEDMNKFMAHIGVCHSVRI